MTTAPSGQATPLRADDVHVWAFGLDLAPPRVEALRCTLSSDELQRAGRFRFTRHRHRFVAARGQLREILARYTGGQPAAIAFAYGPQGKPRLADGGTVRFNLSHSEDEAIVAVCHNRELGVDLERVRPEVECEKIARSFFSPLEAAELMALPGAARPRAFFAGWTRKEAFVKAMGGGLGVPLADFDVSLDPGGPARLIRTGWDPQEAGRWSLRAIAALPGYCAAMAVEGPRPRLHLLSVGPGG